MGGSAPRGGCHLPVETTGFVDRRDEQAAGRELLARARLVASTGRASAGPRPLRRPRLVRRRPRPLGLRRPRRAAATAVTAVAATAFTAARVAGGTARLTRRETEAAELVAEGLGGRQSAERLVTARRTAEGHAERVLGKLGFSNRSQIAARVTARR